MAIYSLEKVVGKQLKKKGFWTEFHVLRTSAQFTRQELFGSLGAVFIQTVTLEVFEQLLSDTYITKTVRSPLDLAILFLDSPLYFSMIDFAKEKPLTA